MENDELEDKVTVLEELIQGFTKRLSFLETGMADLLKNFLAQYRSTLAEISARIETANQRYDDAKIARQIEELKGLVATVPKVISVKTSHHFGAWSKSLIAGMTMAFLVTSGSVGTALYFQHQNSKLSSEAYNFWLVRALYPKVAKTIDVKLAADPAAFTARAEKEMTRQQAIGAAQAVSDSADKEQRAAKKQLEKIKAGK